MYNKKSHIHNYKHTKYQTIHIHLQYLTCDTDYLTKT